LSELWSENLKKETLGKPGNIFGDKFKWILKKYDTQMLTRFIRLIRGTSVSLLRTVVNVTAG
jgi:hypothetical protein